MAATLPLGRKVAYPTRVDAGVLFPIARAQARGPLGIDAAALPFAGVDIWNAWELSWLDGRGKPCVAVAELRVPCASPNLVESKSLKLYLGGYALTGFDGADAVRARIADDVSACVGATVEVTLHEPAAFGALQAAPLPGVSLDAQPLAVTDYTGPHAEYLSVAAHAPAVEDALFTRLFRSQCPVTGQPDWASIGIRYRGAPIDHAGLLRYLVSFREHPDFHEACTERIFIDLSARCRPAQLAVSARFLRRGGIDINPWRATPGFAGAPVNVRTPRQ